MLTQAGGQEPSVTLHVTGRSRADWPHEEALPQKAGGAGGNLVGMPCGAEFGPWNPCEKLGIDVRAGNFSTTEAERGGPLGLVARQPHLVYKPPPQGDFVTRKMDSSRRVPEPDL